MRDASSGARVLHDPSALAARDAVRALATAAGLADDELQGLITAVSEVVTNARTHGEPPVVLRARVEPREVVVEVCDGGTGPDRAVGHKPDPRELANGGMGLWLASQLVTSMTTSCDSRGYTVRLGAAR